jgi:hypothetical protein
MKNYIARLKQDGIIVAEVVAHNKEQAEREIKYYALMYSQDGIVEIIRNYEQDEKKKKYLKTHKCSYCNFKGKCYKHSGGYICDKCDSWCRK